METLVLIIISFLVVVVSLVTIKIRDQEREEILRRVLACLQAHDLRKGWFKYQDKGLAIGYVNSDLSVFYSLPNEYEEFLEISTGDCRIELTYHRRSPNNFIEMQEGGDTVQLKRVNRMLALKMFEAVRAIDTTPHEQGEEKVA